MKNKRKGLDYKLMSDYEDVTPKGFYRLSAIGIAKEAKRISEERDNPVVLIGVRFSSGLAEYHETFDLDQSHVW